MQLLKAIIQCAITVAALASCTESKSLAEGSVKISIDGPDRIEKSQALLTLTISNFGDQAVCFFFEDVPNQIAGRYFDSKTDKEYEYLVDETFYVEPGEGQYPVPGVKTSIGPGLSIVRRGYSISIDNFRSRDEEGLLVPYRRGDAVTYLVDNIFFPCEFDNYSDARGEYIYASGVSRPYFFN